MERDGIYIGCLKAIPKVLDDAGGVYHVFEIIKRGIALELTVFPFEEDVRLRMFREGEVQSLFEYQIIKCQAAHYKKDKFNNEYLLFVNRDRLQVTISVKPDIKISIKE